jgi:hypothetical protein
VFPSKLLFVFKLFVRLFVGFVVHEWTSCVTRYWAHLWGIQTEARLRITNALHSLNAAGPVLVDPGSNDERPPRRRLPGQSHPAMTNLCIRFFSS